MRLATIHSPLLLFMLVASGGASPIAAQLTERESVATGGIESAAGGIRVCGSRCTMIYFHNQWPSISHDGRFLSFYSLADNLVAGDDNGYTDVFLRDRETDTTSIVSRNGSTSGNGNSSLPYLSRSGEYITFRSEANNLVSSDLNGFGDIFLYGKATGQIELVSNNSDGWQANGESFNSAISPDGRYIAFDSLASNLVNNDGNNTYDIFLHDRHAGTTERITINSAGIEADGPSFDPTFSADGNTIVFYSFADNLVGGDNNGESDVFIYDMNSRSIELVSVNGNGEVGNSASVMPAISSDGRIVSFRSLASNFVPGDTNHTFDIFVRNLDKQAIQRVNISTGGSQATAPSLFSSISEDGTKVVFDSYANNLIPGDTNNGSDIFLHDLSSGEIARISVNSSDAEANQSSNLPVISGDGRYVAFESFASNLVANDNNGNKDIFIRDLGPRNRPPVADAGDDQTVECTGSSTAIILDGSRSYDPDGDTLKFTWQGPFGVADGAFQTFFMGLGTMSADLTVDDLLGGVDSDSVQMNVADTIAPIIEMPSVIYLEAESASGTHHQLRTSYREECGTAFITIAPGGDLYPLGETLVTIEVGDVGNNVSRHTMGVNVTDTTPPQLTPPVDINAEATAPLTTIDIGLADAWDAVGMNTITNNGIGDYPVGETIVTWTAQDAQGNHSVATQKIIVSDTTPPALTLPADIAVEATASRSLVDIGLATATDLVDGTLPVVHNAPAGGFPVGTTQVTWRSIDSRGNEASAIQVVTVTDRTAPLLTVPVDIVVEAAAPLTPVAIGTASTNDIFDVTVSNDAPAVFPVGVTVITWVAEDIHGNRSSGQQTVTVQDTTPPALSVPSNMTIEASGILSQVNLGEASAVDLVDGAVNATNNSPVDGFPLGTTVVIWSASDQRGNSVTTEQLITVRDTSPPVLTPPDEITVTATGPLTTVELGTAKTSDIFDVTLSNDAPQQLPVGTTRVTWTAEDSNGNITTALQNVNVRYAFGGYLPPLAEGKLFRGARTIPVKLRLSYAGGAPVKDAEVKFLISQLDANGQKIAIDLTSSKRFNPDDLFRFTGNKYLFLLKTRALETGTYLIESIPNDNSGAHSITIRYQQRTKSHNEAREDYDDNDEHAKSHKWNKRKLAKLHKRDKWKGTQSHKDNREEREDDDKEERTRSHKWHKWKYTKSLK